ncbi:ATP-independent RNA helicase DbpA [Marinobacter sp. DSM 26671]|jgi:ATP-independent RNA helicase DbpA|uniref:ATP-dependent RNA helicase DbpA n=3 Tax=Marinobacter TaxID=2742 RepID=A0A3D8H0V7_9GAMM|nr:MULTISPECIES: ATP-dependent RNA helicase DbpA [Marinobacter]MCP4063638.1 ATP-dependent RNA helicase DbpA [Gammaproteobacteria bacterium]HAP53497.1 ATP-dependent RNA helicase DbpA [Marinobacter adhaerens]AKV97825.1 RNA helicase [Marinobacter sp. CP1]EHJ05122.1 DEAD/DEAH box helicase domain-containing protein [Marinobacter manganoxydans MnI7-9]MAK50185.1 ATP-dependent RNA helicase DbpA [Marinobacter sp.]|tara:strand:+ start:456 stop:1829 length:1374 start_codon:yes stop_codon:yes gene_type:complete
MSSFNDFGLSTAMCSNLNQLGFAQPTEIQAKAIAPGLAGKDIIAMAKTGSGKTAAFGISLVERLNPRLFAVQALVLCPTRELADQVAKAIRELARARDNIKVLTLCGGVAIGPQIGSLSHGAHIVVGTPGRIQDHLRKQTLSLARLKTVVLDEADRMLDMGFQEAMEDILSQTPPSRQTMMFSATWPAPIRELSKQYQKSPVDVRAEEAGDNPDIEELFYEVSPHSKSDAIVALLSERQPESCIVFCTTKQQCDDMAAELGERGFSALPLHGDLEQRDRDSVLVRFGNQSCSILVATDVAARGLDIKSLPLVINAEPARDPEVHTHRIGRTGRAGERGHAVTFCTPAQGHKITRIESERGRSVTWGDTEKLLATPLKPVVPAMKTLCIAGGRKDKVRPGDVLGALTGEAGLPGKAVGKIDLFDHQCFVAVEKSLAAKALARLESGKVKGRKIRVRYA